MKEAVAQKRQSIMQLSEPELSLTRHAGDGPDPRLVELVRLLARRAARKRYEEMIEGRHTRRS